MNSTLEKKKVWNKAHLGDIRIYQRKWRSNNPDKSREYSKKWRLLNPDYSGRDSYMRRRYGITLTEYNAMLIKQHGGCAICGKPSGKRSFHIDHCHSSGAVRGLLCSRCNTGIGMFQENPHLMIEAITYLMETTSNDVIKETT